MRGSKASSTSSLLLRTLWSLHHPTAHRLHLMAASSHQELWLRKAFLNIKRVCPLVWSTGGSLQNQSGFKFTMQQRWRISRRCAWLRSISWESSRDLSRIQDNYQKHFSKAGCSRQYSKRSQKRRVSSSITLLLFWTSRRTKISTTASLSRHLIFLLKGARKICFKEDLLSINWMHSSSLESVLSTDSLPISKGCLIASFRILTWKGRTIKHSSSYCSRILFSRTIKLPNSQGSQDIRLTRATLKFLQRPYIEKYRIT